MPPDENVGPSPETVGEAYALNYIWDAAKSRLFLSNFSKAIGYELLALVRAYPTDWRSNYQV